MKMEQNSNISIDMVKQLLGEDVVNQKLDVIYENYLDNVLDRILENDEIYNHIEKEINKRVKTILKDEDVKTKIDYAIKSIIFHQIKNTKININSEIDNDFYVDSNYNEDVDKFFK